VAFGITGASQELPLVFDRLMKTSLPSAPFRPCHATLTPFASAAIETSEKVRNTGGVRVAFWR